MEINNENKARRFKTKKAILIFVIALFIVIGAFFIKPLIKIVRAIPNTVLSFTPASKLVGNNQDFTLDAMIDPRTNQISAVELHLTYDQTKFRLDSVNTAGSPFSVTLQAVAIDNTNGTASFVLAIPASSPPVPVTTLSKLATLSFHSLAAAASSSIAFTTASQAAALGEGSVNVITDRNPALITVDATAPTGGSINYTNGYRTTASVALTASDGTDSVSGINTGSRIFQRRSATMTNNNCGTYSSWTAVNPTGTYPNFTDGAVATGNCYQYSYLVSDNVGNQATYVGASTVKIDTVAPIAAQVTAVPNLTNDSTPDYTFSSSEAGTITYGGDCSSATSAASSGNNTITFNTLSSNTHSNCTIRVADMAGNQSNILAVSPFTVDAILPTIANVNSAKANGPYGLGAVIDITVTFSEAVTSTGNVTVTLDTGRTCIFTVNNITSGTCNYTVQTGDNSADLTTTSISGTIKDQAGNTMTNFTPAINLGANKNLVINAVSPVLTPVTAVPNITNNLNPVYTFSSSKAGTITYGGDCSSSTTAAVSGNNTVTFNTLAIGSHSNCTITVADSSNNASAPLAVNVFVITYRGDLNTDRTVDIFDYNILIANFGNTTCGNAADADKNCSVNIFDYNIIIEDFGKKV